MATCKVEFYKKNGYKAFETEDEYKVTLENSLVSVRINRSIDTPTAEAVIVAQYEKLPTAIFSGGTLGIIDNFAQVKIYINNIIQFTGVMKKYSYNTNERTIEMSCHDMYYRMLNLCDTELKFNNMTAENIIASVVREAKCSFLRTGGTDYTVNKLECEIGTMYNDIISNLSETMYARIRANKVGTIILEEQYPFYDEKNHDLNTQDYIMDGLFLSEENSSRDANLLRNVLKICCNDDYSIFEEPDMTTYLNSEKWLEIIDNPLATNLDLRKKVAGHKFLDLWRGSTSISTVPVKGIPEIDLGQVIRVKTTRGGWYMIVGINTEVSKNTYIDSLQLQGMRDKRTIYKIPKLIGSGKIKQQ